MAAVVRAEKRAGILRDGFGVVLSLALPSRLFIECVRHSTLRCVYGEVVSVAGI